MAWVPPMLLWACNGEIFSDTERRVGVSALGLGSFGLRPPGAGRLAGDLRALFRTEALCPFLSTFLTNFGQKAQDCFVFHVNSLPARH